MAAAGKVETCRLPLQLPNVVVHVHMMYPTILLFSNEILRMKVLQMVGLP